MTSHAARVFAVAVAVLVASGLLGLGTASAGIDTALDEAFATGQVNVDLRANDNGRKLATRPDGTIVVGGVAGDPGLLDGDPAFVELNAQGVMDQTFGPPAGGGRAIIDLGQPAGLTDFELADDGSIVAIAVTPTQFSTSFLFRLDTDGALDPTFGTGGKTEVDFDGNPGSWLQVELQDDGMIVVAGTVFPTGGETFQTAVARFTEDGDPDPTFGDEGITVVQVGADNSHADDLAISPGGDRLAVVSSQVVGANGRGRVGVLQFLTSDGSPDTGFSGDGQVATPFGTTSIEGFALAYQPNGRIVVGAVTRPATFQENDPLVLRYLANGALDDTFDTDGIAVVAMDRGLVPSAVFVRGGTITALGSGIGAFRLTGTGGLDPTFDADGRVELGPPTSHTMADAIPSANGTILTVGNSSPVTGADMVVTRMLGTGVPDPAFGGGGTATYSDFPAGVQNDAAASAAVDLQGRIVLAGVSEYTGDAKMAALRLHPSGYRDPAYAGLNGLVTADFPDAEARDVAMSGNRAVLVGCQNCSAASSDMAVLRLTGAGVPDATFSDDGHTIIQAGPVGLTEQASAVAVQADGRVVVAGTVGNDLLLARLNTNGTPDTTFGPDGTGRVQTDIGTATIDRVFDMVIQPNGRIVVVGSRLAGSQSRLAVLRYLANGRLDGSFSTDGKLVIGIVGQQHTEGTAVALRPDGRILVGGGGFGAEAQAAIVRLTSTGGFDNTFSGDGRATFALDAGDDVVVGIASAPDNRIVFGGWGRDGDYYAARVLPGGGLDSTFGSDSNGREYAGFEGFADARGMTVEPGTGRIVVVGEAESTQPGFYFAAARFDP